MGPIYQTFCLEVIKANSLRGLVIDFFTSRRDHRESIWYNLTLESKKTKNKKIFISNNIQRLYTIKL